MFLIEFLITDRDRERKIEKLRVGRGLKRKRVRVKKRDEIWFLIY